MYTMRIAFFRWLMLYNEHMRTRVPHWFRYYVRDNVAWNYVVTNTKQRNWCDDRQVSINRRRAFSGHYEFNISDEGLISLQRPEWIPKT